MLSVPRAILQLLSRRRGDRAERSSRSTSVGRRPDGAHPRRGRAPRRPGARRRAARPAGRPPRQPRARRTTWRRWPPDDTAVVATGQQVGLFLGPLYAFYKAASAIAVARALEAESGVRCVPLFWLQTEDHDFAEIASATVAGARRRSRSRCRSPPSRRRRRASRSRTAGSPPEVERAARPRSASCWAPARPPRRRWRSCAPTTAPGARSRRRSPASWPSCSPTRGS